MSLLGAIAAAAGLLFALACVGPACRGRAGAIGIGGLCAVTALLDVVFLLSGARPMTLVLPFGLPGIGATLALDGLGGFVLLLPALVGLAAAPLAPSRLIAALVGGMMLTLLAGDAFTMALGFAATAFAAVAAGAGGRPAALAGPACLLGALGLLTTPDGAFDPGFAALRAHPPEGMRAACVMALALAAVASQAGQAARPGAASAPLAALLSAVAPKVAASVLIRLVFDLCGPVQPLAFGVPLIVLGLAAGVAGSLRATQAGDAASVLACAAVANAGLVATGLGLALAARSADLPALAALALGAALLLMLAHGLFGALLVLAAGAVQTGAGTSTLALLGGLIHRMPQTTGAALAGAACLAGIPPAAGFAGIWMLLQAAIGAVRIGGTGVQMLACLTVLLVAGTTALTAVATVRLIGIGFLGRPRSPRAAAAEEAPRDWRIAMAGLAGASLLVGLFPGGVLALAAPAVRVALGPGSADRTGLLVVAAQAGAPGYTPLAVALLLAAALGLAAYFTATRTVRGHRLAPAWDGGAGAPPPWLPFGDPATQPGPAGLTQMLRLRWVGMPKAARWPALPELADRIPVLTLRRVLALLLAVLVLTIAALP